MTSYPTIDSYARPFAAAMSEGEATLEAESEFRSALSRLPMAVIAADEERMLRPLNAFAERLFDEEALDPDLLDGYRAHPIAKLIRAADASGSVEPRQTVAFPSGRRYCVRMSTPSSRGTSGWLLLLIEALTETSDDVTELFDRWRLTAREREIAGYLMRGASTPVICLSAGIAANTLRTHVRSILDKSGTHRRSTFIAEVLGRKRA